MGGDLAGASEPFRVAYQQDRGNPIVRLTLGQYLALAVRRDEARQAFERALAGDWAGG